MKRFFIILASGMCAAFCALSCYQDDFDDLQAAIDELNNSTVASISEQVAAIEASISSMETLCGNFNSYISALQTQAASLEAALSDTDYNISLIEEDIASLQEDYYSALDDSSDALRSDFALQKAELLAQLAALRTSLSTELETVNSSVSSLSEKASSLEDSISALEALALTLQGTIDSTVEATATNYETWAEATFLTLEQYYELSDSVAALKTGIETVNGTLKTLSDSVVTLLLSEVDSTVNAIVSTYLTQYAETELTDALETAIAEITSEYKTAIETATAEITEAYETAIESELSDLEESLTEWVSEQLAGYYTISQTDAALDSLQTSLENQLAVDRAYLEALIAELSFGSSEYSATQALLDSVYTVETSNTEAIDSLSSELSALKEKIAEAYTAVITSAVAEYEGMISSEIDEVSSTVESEISKVTDSMSELSTSVSTLSSRVLTVEASISSIQETIASLIDCIQSFTFVPTYSDGTATLWFSYGITKSYYNGRYAVLDFKIRPAEAAEKLAEVWESALSAHAIYAATRSSAEKIDLEVTGAEADEDGMISITISAEELTDDEFYGGYTTAYVSVEISNGTDSRCSAYVQLEPEVLMVEPEYVDLGLSVNWATWNLGATAPEETGFYYAWSMTQPAYAYTNNSVTNYGTSLDAISGYRAYDAATRNLGYDWQMPTSSECTELKDDCTWALDTLNTVPGWRVTGANGNSIFLPQTGRVNDTSLNNSSRMYLWTGTEYTKSSGYIAYSLYCNATSTTPSLATNQMKYYGCPIRPVYVGE